MTASGTSAKPSGPTISRSGSDAAKVNTMHPSAPPSSPAPIGSARRRTGQACRRTRTSAAAARTSPTTPIGVIKRAVLVPNGTNGPPRFTLLASKSGAQSARPRTTSAAPTTTRRMPRARPPEATSPLAVLPESRPRPPTRAISSAKTIPPKALSQKIARQSATARMRAPRMGPRTEPSSWTPPTIPSGRPRRSSGQSAATMASVAGTRPPPPMPWMTRPATSTDRSTARAVTPEPTTKIATHPSRTRWRSRRSARRPIRGSTATYPRRKPEMIGAARWRLSMPRPTPCIMSVRASTTT